METPMWNRLKAILADFIQQADLVLLGLCCAATLYGMALIASATRYLNIGGIVRYVGVQGAAMVLGICAYIFMSMLDLERLMRRWKWLVAFNVVFIALLLTPFGVSDNTGNTAWLKFPFLPFSIGPAEVVKITFTLLLAKQLEWLREVKRDLKSFPSALMVAGHTIALMGWYVGISGDMGNGLTFFNQRGIGEIFFRGAGHEVHAHLGAANHKGIAHVIPCVAHIHKLFALKTAKMLYYRQKVGKYLSGVKLVGKTVPNRHVGIFSQFLYDILAKTAVFYAVVDP